VHRRVTVLLAALLVVGAAAPSAADGTGDAYSDDQGIGVDARDNGGNGGRSGGSGGSTNPCRYEVLDERGQQAAQGLADGGWSQSVPGDGPGRWYRRICDIGNGQTTGTTVWLPDPVVDPAELARQASDRAPIPSPEIRLNPPAGEEQVVNVPMWMWINPSAWQQVSASASAGAVTVTATATPTSTSWDMGNGDVVVCAGPGTPYDTARPAAQQQSDCTYTYRRSSASQPGAAYRLTVTTTWSVTWTVSGAPGGGSLGTASRSSTSSVRVAEIQTVND
jgi:hypothetical protein